MLCMNLFQASFNLSNEGVEDSISNNYAMCMFMKLDFMIISVMQSVKNADKKRDEEMPSTRKGRD